MSHLRTTGRPAGMLDGILAVLISSASFARTWTRVHATGFPLMFAYLAAAWAGRWLPETVYALRDPVQVALTKAVALLLLTDFVQTCVHWAIHRRLLGARLAASHKVHHRHIVPSSEDAHDTGAHDALAQLVLPVHAALHLIRPDRLGLTLFGCAYSWWILYIHDDRAWPCDGAFARLGLVTPRYHAAHHKDARGHFANIVVAWDAALSACDRALAR